MTEVLRAQVLLQVLSLAPMGGSNNRFEQLANAGDVKGFWNYYETCLRDLMTLDEKIERDGKISFRMIASCDGSRTSRRLAGATVVQPSGRTVLRHCGAC